MEQEKEERSPPPELSDQQITRAIESLQYNPNFQLTPEVIDILHQFFDRLHPEKTGTIKSCELKDSIRKFNEQHGTYLLALYDPECDDLSFDEFCDLVLHWRDLSPKSLEIVYHSWMSHVAAVDFTDGDCDVFPAPTKPEPALIPPSESHTSTVARSFIAGGMAGITAKSFLAPVDRVKLIFQVSKERFTLQKALQLGRKILRQDGFQALFRGNSAIVLRVMPYAGIQHSSFDFFRRQFMRYNEVCGDNSVEVDEESAKLGKLSRTQMILAGSLAGGLSVVCTYPLDIVRARLAVRQGEEKYHGVFNALVGMYREQGLSSFARGLSPTLLGVLPYTGIGFALNEYMKHYLLLYQTRHRAEDAADVLRLSTLSKFTCSYFAASIAQSATYPLDVVRRRMQTEGFIRPNTSPNSVSNAPVAKYSTIIGTARVIMREEGWRGLYKGLSVNWLRSPLATGLSLTAYDFFKEALQVEKVY